MSYAVSASTSNGQISVHSSSVAQIRMALKEARADGATTVSLSQDGKTITESQLGKVTQALLTGVTASKSV